MGGRVAVPVPVAEEVAVAEEVELALFGVPVGRPVAAGVREFLAVAVVADTGVPISPCGACRQVLAEFGVPRVMLANRSERLEFMMEELLPRASAGILDRPQ